MYKRLISVMLMIVFMIPFTIQAADIGVSAPSYQVDVLSSAVDTGQNEVATVNTVSNKSQPEDINVTLFKPHCIMAIPGVLCHSAAAGINGVPGGGSIGIRQPS